MTTKTVETQTAETQNFASLRLRAEEKFSQIEAAQRPRTPLETEQLLHELQVHQIELKMQNDQLRYTQGELESARADYFDLYDLAPVGYLTLSAEGVILKANLAAATMLGVVRNFLLNKRMWQFIFLEDQDVYFNLRKQFIENGKLQSWEMRLKRADGSTFWAQLQATLAHNGENWIALSDITERKQMEAEILNTKVIKGALEYSENIVETLRSPLLVLDSGLKILSANGSFYATFRVTPEETIGKYIYDLGNRQWDISKLRLLLEKILTQNITFNDYEVEHFFESIGRKCIILNARQIFRKEIGSHIILLAMEDITERKLNSMALDERTKELSCLYSIISLFHLPDITMEEIFMKTVMRLPPAWQFPDITEACIEMDGKSFQTPGYRETPWMLVSDIKLNGRQIGQLKICYLEERQAHDEGPFLIHERHLINALAEKLGIKIEQTRSDLELQKSEERHRTILHTVMDGFWLTDSQGRILEVNDAYCQMSGYSQQELLSMSIQDIDANETASDTVAHIQKIQELGEVRFESRHRHKNGTFFDIEISVQYQSFENGFFVAFLRDISERKQSESRMRKLARAVDQSPVSIVITDTDGIIQFVNPMFTRFTGYSDEEAIGQNSRVLKSGMTPPETYQKLWSTITAGEVWKGEFVNKRKDGSIYYEHATISSIRNDKGEITHYLAAKVDVTEKKSIMEQLIHSQKVESIGQLAGGLAHDLNNILTVVNGYATLARLRVEKDEPQVINHLDEIVKASLRASSLTRSLLIYSRKQEMNQQKQNLNSLITTVGSFIERIIHDNIVFTISLAEEPLGVYVDDGQIEQVLLNLTTNARDAMPDGGTFSIKTAAGEMDEEYITTHGFGAVGRYAVITVTDSGHGMDAETKRKVFNPFFTTKDVGKGTGLGLAMVMGIIKQHGGFVELQSEPGKGSVFKLYLPLLAGPVVIASEDVRDARMEGGSGTILLAEDDPTTLILLEELLKRAGYSVITAVDGEDAVKKFVAFDDEIQLVILDVVMPKLSGKQARDRIREISEGMKFIFVSGHSDDVIKREGGLGADVEIIMKPVMPFDLLRKIREMIVPPAKV